jgi:hypothetical protein
MDLEGEAPTPDAEGIFATDVVPGTPASRLRLPVPAVITAIRGIPIYEPVDEADDQKIEQYCEILGPNRTAGKPVVRMRRVRRAFDEFGLPSAEAGRPRNYAIPLN